MPTVSEPIIQFPHPRDGATPPGTFIDVVVELDRDIVEAFKRRGPDWQLQIEAILSSAVSRRHA